MTLSTLLRNITLAIREQTTAADEDRASKLLAQAQRLDEEVRQAERMEHVNSVCLKALPLHPTATMGELVG